MKAIKPLFVTQLYVSKLSDVNRIDILELEASCHSIAEDDLAGQQWCEDNGYQGYTSYASLTDLVWRFPIFNELKDILDRHVARFVKNLDFDLNDRDLILDDMWINILNDGGSHGYTFIHTRQFLAQHMYQFQNTLEKLDLRILGYN